MWNITWEINLEKEEADSPLEAALWANKELALGQVQWAFYVQDDETGNIFSVDLEEEEGQEVIKISPSEYFPIIKPK